jgi:hypothetical protein
MSWRRRLAMLTVIFSPIWADAVRRFFWYSDVMFLAVGAIVVSTAIWVMVSQRRVFSLRRSTGLAVGLLSLWAIIAFVATHNHIKIFAVWILATYLPLAMLVVSSYLFTRDPEAPKYLYYACTAWVIMMTVVGATQIALGIGHPINRLPQESDSVSMEVRHGIGDYTVANGAGDSSYVGISGIFRPTSIFLSNGKFGQALFILVLFRWAFLYRGAKRITLGLVSTLLIDVLGLMISGQRAALVFLSIFAVVIVLRGTCRGERRAVYMFAGFGGLTLLAMSVLLIVNPEIAELVTSRYVSGFTDISERLTDNLWTPSSTIFGLYGLMGEGPGFFSLGAQKFGGAMMWQVLTTNGNAEGVWMRIMAELGVSGLALYLWYHGGLIYQALRQSYLGPAALRSSCVFALAWLISVALWGITHDTFANAFGMALGFGLCGAAFSPTRARNHVLNPSISTETIRLTSVPVV